MSGLIKQCFIYYDALKTVTQNILMHTNNFSSGETTHECKEDENKIK